MKSIAFVVSCFCFISSMTLMAQTADVKIKDIPAATDEGGTTIEIHKRSKMDQKLEWQITEGTEELNGDAAPLLKEARTNWKKACEDWKKELKELNKDNKIITVSCGKMDCVTAAMETTCKSTASHKIKVKVN